MVILWEGHHLFTPLVLGVSTQEGSIASSNREYETAPAQESSQSTALIPIPPPGVCTSEELAPSPPISQLLSPSLSFGGGRVLCTATKMKALKVQQHRSTWDVGSLFSHKESSSSSGPIGPSPKKLSSKVSSPGLEYVNKYTQKVCDACPLRYTDPEVIDCWTKEQVPYEVTIGRVPLDLLDVRATLHSVIPGCNLIQHKSVLKLN